MGIFYILSLIVLCLGFLIYKKSDEKLNFVKWLIITIVSIYAYNIVIGMILGLLNITAHIWILAIINLAFGAILGVKPIIKRDIQKYKVTKFDIAGILLILVLFSVMFVKDLYIYNGDISHFAVDSAIHYRAAKHYSDNLKIFINVEDKSFFNFNIMQTGAYINDGIFMNVINNITGLDYAYIYQIFETLTLFLIGLAFYAFFAEKIKTKRGLIASLGLFVLYIYGYPYNSWIYGFSYLSVGILMTTLLLSVVESLYSKEMIKKRVAIPLIVITSFCLIFSYCLFVPAIFSAICIYCFLKDLLNKETKKYLKIFGKNTLIVTGLLLIVTAVGIGYLFIPSFFIEGQTNLISALKIDGGVYSEKYINFIPYIPFAILYFAEIIKRIKNKSLRYQDIFSVVIVGYTAFLYLGMLAGVVTKYYMLKTYFILWIGIFAAIIDLVNEYVDKRIFRIDAMVMFALFVLLTFKDFTVGIFNAPMIQIGIYDLEKTVFKEISKIIIIFLSLFLALYTVLPELVKHIDLSNFKKIPEKFRKNIEIKPIKVAPYVYAIIWTVFVCSWVMLKAGGVLGEAEKHNLPNLVGMYYSENCEYRKLIDLTQNFNSNEIELSVFARENLEDMTVENTELITEGYYTRIWATAMLEFSSEKVKYQDVIQDTKLYTVDDALNDNDKKYIVKLVSKDAESMKRYNEELDDVKENENIEVLFENANGFVAKINR